MASLYERLCEGWRSEPDRVFLRVPGGPTWTYGALALLAADLSTVLRGLGAARGERVMVQVDKSPESVALYLAALRIGAIYVPLNTAYTPAEVEYFAANARPAVFVGADTGVEEMLPPGTRYATLRPDGSGTLMDPITPGVGNAEPTPGSGSDIVAMLYTSGTTGRSKGAMLTSDNLVSNADALYEIWRWQPEDVLLHLLPIFHVHGLFVALHCAMLGGSEVIFLDRFSVEAARTHLPEATVMMGVPTYYHRLIADDAFGPQHAHRMRLFTSGSAPLTEAAHRAFQAKSGHVILERYGMTEAGMITSNPYDGPRVAGTVGYPLPDVAVRVVNEAGRPVPPGTPGQVQARGPNVFAGYWEMPEKTAETFTLDGYLRTGDIGSLSEDGRLTLAGRSSDMIISGGLNVYPKEVELVLDDVDGVVESAVVGVAHPDLGEAVVAFIVGSATAGTLAEACGSQLAPFKQPKTYVHVSELPRNAMGKIQKNELRSTHTDLFRSG
jgi:malonyl-CoA/methylmalonyl-CoA synthetase